MWVFNVMVLKTFMINLTLMMNVFLMDTLSLGGLWTFNVPEILEGQEAFNYFFSLVMAFGLIAAPIAILVRLVSKS